MSGLSRYMRLLRLFDEASSEWTVADLAAALSAPASTVYRAVRDMVAEGLLEAGGEARYRLGPGFIAFDRLIRVTDPLYRIGTELLRDVALQARLPCVAVLARLHGDEVMCIAEAATPDHGVRTSYERGRPRPLTRGATSKVILAQVPAKRLARLLVEASEAGPFAKTPAELREELSLIRKRGYAVTRGEVDKGLIGIAASVAVPERGLIGSLSLVVEEAALDAKAERRLVLLTVSSASLLTGELALRPRVAEAASVAR